MGQDQVPFQNIKCHFKINGRIAGAIGANPASSQPEVHPHAAVQLSVFNDKDYEFDTVNDLATHAVPGQGAPPNLSMLIKSREANAPIQAGFDICHLPVGTFLPDAVNGTNGASHVVHNYGGADVVVTITEANLGGIALGVWESIKNLFSGRGNDFELSVAKSLFQIGCQLSLLSCDDESHVTILSNVIIIPTPIPPVAKTH